MGNDKGSFERGRQPAGDARDEADAADAEPGAHMRLLGMRRQQVRRKAAAGAQLPHDVRAKMEPQLGHDLSHVRIHTSGESAQAAEGFGARAFTVGGDIHFGAGEYKPGTREGDRLIGHELAHTVQAQRAPVQRKPTAEGAHSDEPEVSSPGEPAEEEADAVGDKVADALHDEGAAKKKPEEKPSLSAAAPAVGRKVMRQAKAPDPPKPKPRPKPIDVGTLMGKVKALRNASGGDNKSWMTFAMIELVDKDGGQVGLAAGDYLGEKGPHAEEVALGSLEGQKSVQEAIADKSLAGGKMTAVIDQFPCPEDKANCEGRLKAYAAKHGVTLDVHVISAPDPKKPGQMLAPKTGAAKENAVPYLFPEYGYQPPSPALAGVSSTMTTVAEVLPKVTKAYDSTMAMMTVFDMALLTAGILTSKGGKKGMMYQEAVTQADAIANDAKTAAAGYDQLHAEVWKLVPKIASLTVEGDVDALNQADQQLKGLFDQLQELRTSLKAQLKKLKKRVQEVSLKRKALEQTLENSAVSSALDMAGQGAQEVTMFAAMNDMQQVGGRLETACASITHTLETLDEDLGFLTRADADMTKSATAAAGKSGAASKPK